MNYPRLLIWLGGLAVTLGLIGAIAFFTRDRWWPWLSGPQANDKDKEKGHEHAHAERVKLTPQARQNLMLESGPVKVQDYTRKITIPGVVVDRPGRSDRGVAATVVSAVTKIHVAPGDTVKPGQTLFTLRLLSEYMQQAQSDIYKATKEISLLGEQRKILEPGVKSGGIPESRLLELDFQIRRQEASARAARQDLLTRGFTQEQLKGVSEEGKFVTEVVVVAPAPLPDERPLLGGSSGTQPLDLAYEIKELKVQLGEQVQAGQILALLANHQSLSIEGRAFKQEAPWLERAAREGWTLDVEFPEDKAEGWPSVEQPFAISYLANSIDPVSRTFAFYMPLANQARSFTRGDRTFLVWRFRPGQRVRLGVPVEEFKDVIVLPVAAVVREGPEAYVFRQNGDAFERKPVHVVYEDRRNVVIANDGSLAPGQYVARNGAESLNRVLKAQSAKEGGGGGHEGHNH